MSSKKAKAEAALPHLVDFVDFSVLFPRTHISDYARRKLRAAKAEIEAAKIQGRAPVYTLPSVFRLSGKTQSRKINAVLDAAKTVAGMGAKNIEPMRRSKKRARAHAATGQPAWLRGVAYNHTAAEGQRATIREAHGGAWVIDRGIEREWFYPGEYTTADEVLAHMDVVIRRHRVAPDWKAYAAPYTAPPPEPLRSMLAVRDEWVTDDEYAEAYGDQIAEFIASHKSGSQLRGEESEWGISGIAIVEQKKRPARG